MNTTVNAPSVRSPKARPRMPWARSESVPGTAKEFESSYGSRIETTAPNPASATHNAKTT